MQKHRVTKMNLMRILWAMIIAVIGSTVGQNNTTKTSLHPDLPAPFHLNLAGGLKSWLKQLDEKHPIREYIAKFKKTIHENIGHIELKRLNIIKHCYNDTFNGKRLNIFNTSVYTIIEEYFTVIRSSHFDLYKSHQHILNFLANLKQLILDIVDCAYHPDKSIGLIGITSLTHLGDDEFDRMLNHGLFLQKQDGQDDDDDDLQLQHSPHDSARIPDTYNCRDHGLVTRVQHQGLCGSCFIFSALANVEGRYLQMRRGKTKAKNMDLSEQAIMDCIDDDVCYLGGQPQDVWKQMQNEPLTVDEKTCPYTGEQSWCRHDLPQSRHKFKITGYKIFSGSKNRPELIQKRILKYGPISGAICVTKKMKSLRGKFHGECCSKINHAITIVGWDQDYWIIKNSWGRNHGVDGYLYLPRDRDNVCSVQQMTATAFLALN